MAYNCTPCKDTKLPCIASSNTSSTSKMNKFKAEWTGKCPCPYKGEWKLYKNGEDITYMMPTVLRSRPAYTCGDYPVWEECPYACVQQYVRDGYATPEWIQTNLFWLKLICDSPEDYKNIYITFHESDFRTSRWM